MEELYTALFNFKKEVGAISKDETNPFFKSKYFDINGLVKHIDPLLGQHGLLLLQPIEAGFVSSRIIHVKTGQMVSSNIEMNKIDDPQKLGSMITYYRRYTLQSLLGLQAEDDDANSVSGANKQASNDDGKQWLNLVTRDGKHTKEYNALKTSIDAGNMYTLVQMQAKYKISKVTQEVLLNDFGIK